MNRRALLFGAAAAAIAPALPKPPIQYDLIGFQPMTGPTGQIFVMRPPVLRHGNDDWMMAS